MSERVPPKFALWLLKQGGSSYHSDSLAGDLIEQYRQGRSRAWCWGQVAAAIAIARARFIRTLPWTEAGRVLSRLLAETAAVLALAVIVDQGRRAHSIAGMTHQLFLGTLAALIAVSWIGFRISARSGGRKRTHSAVHVLMLAFGVIALGAGTLTWAATTLRDACQTAACVCPGN
jgi:hypothetical protein